MPTPWCPILGDLFHCAAPPPLLQSKKYEIYNVWLIVTKIKTPFGKWQRIIFYIQNIYDSLLNPLKDSMLSLKHIFWPTIRLPPPPPTQPIFKNLFLSLGVGGDSFLFLPSLNLTWNKVQIRVGPDIRPFLISGRIPDIETIRPDIR